MMFIEYPVPKKETCNSEDGNDDDDAFETSTLDLNEEDRDLADDDSWSGMYFILFNHTVLWRLKNIYNIMYKNVLLHFLRLNSF